MARQLHIHVHVPVRGKVRDVSISGPLAPKRTADEPSPYEVLVRELMRLMGLGQSTKDDGQEGHPFYGNQYTTVAGLGPKPTEAKSKGVKNQIHELLSSGHPFSFEELKAATGAKLDQQLHNAISEIKKGKHAAGALSIVKTGKGTYQVVQPDGTPAPSLAAVTPAKEPEAPAPETPPPSPPEPPTAAPPPEPAPTPAEPDIKLPGKEHKVSAEGITVPAVKMSKGLADEHYQKQINQLCADLVGSFHADGMDAAAQMWKQGKAQAMAQWATNFHGELKKPAPVQVFKEDKDLVNKLVLLEMDDSMSGAKYLEAQKKAIEEWKSATAQAKQKAFAEAQPKAANDEPAKEKPKAEPKKVPHAPDGPQAFEPPKHIVPDGHEHIGEKDFGPVYGDSFQGGLAHAKQLLESKSKSSETNKVNIASALDERLKASPHFQHLQQQWQKTHGSKYGGSLSAQLISQWASSSGDHHDTSVSSQMAVMEAFGMDKKDVELKQLGALHAVNGDIDALHKKAAQSLGFDVSTPQALDSYKKGLKDFVLAQYHHTQDEFKKMGITHLHLVRGMNIGGDGEYSQTARKVKVKLQPASSFSTNHGTAVGFGHGGSLFAVKVPVEQVLGSYLTGFGCTSEHEVVVLQHPSLEAVQVGLANAGSVPAMVQNIKQNLFKQKGATPTSTPSAAIPGGKTTKPTYAEHGYSNPTLKAKTAKALGEAGNLEGLKAHLASLAGYPQATGYTQQWINHLEANPKKLAQKQKAAGIAAHNASGLPPAMEHFGLNSNNQPELAMKTMKLAEAGDLAGLKEHMASMQTKNAPKTIKYTQAMIKHLESKAMSSAAASAPTSAPVPAGGPTFEAHGLHSPGTLAKQAQQMGLKGDIQGLMAHYASVSQKPNLPKTTAYVKAWLEHLGAEVHG